MRDCNLSFANIFCWQSSLRSAWAEVDGFLVIRFAIDGGDKIGYMQPIGRGANNDFSPIIPQLAADAHKSGERLRIIGVTKEGYEVLKGAYGDEFAVYSDPNFEDYIYLRERLKSLSGKKLQPKRNHINQFIRSYPSYSFRELTPDQFEECLRLDCRWRAAHGDCCDESTPEREAMLRAFSNFETLGLRGGALYVEGRMVAFTYGSQINHDTFCVHIEKADNEIVGGYTMINKLFCESIGDEFLYINREDDLGIEGLRRAKQSYCPEFRQEKYTAIYLHHDEKECKCLWQKVFGDDDDFIDEFLQLHYSPQRMLRVVDSENRYVSMLHIVPFVCELGRVAYIYGVATDETARNLGHATRLMHKALELIKGDRYNAAILIPSEEWLVGYYSKFGFSGAIPTRFVSYNNFDFGSGDQTRDLAMVYPISCESTDLQSITLCRSTL